MSIDPNRIPVVVGVGQSIERDAVVDVIDLATRAAEAAFEDAPGLADRIQGLSFVAVSFSKVSKAPARELATRLGLDDVECEVTTPGGNTPQWLVNRACEAIALGKLETTLICGAEATRSMKLSDPSSDFLTAALSNMKENDGPEDRVVGASVRGLLGKAEIDAKLIRPADTYPLFESALGGKLHSTLAESRARIGDFMSRSSQVAAGNPFAWFQQARRADEIATPNAENRITAEPYTKRMNSFANVDLGSAILVTTLAIAREAGLADQCVFPLAGASSMDVQPAKRRDLSASPAIRAAASAMFQAVETGIDEVDSIELYSCFPVAVEVGAREIGVSLDDSRGLTATGGMSFFGGPGNNYASHGIVATVMRLRESGRLGYVSGNGGLLSKHSLGLYGREPGSRAFALADTSAAQQKIDASAIEVVHEAERAATIVGGTVVYGRDGAPSSAPVIAELPDGRRAVAVAAPEVLPGLTARNLVGETVRLTGAEPPIYHL